MPEEKITQEEFQRIQEDLEDLEKYIEELFTFLPLAICSTNPLEIIIDANQAFRNLSHYPGVEIIGKSLADIFLEKKEIENLLKEVRRKEKIGNKELTLISKEKKEIPVNISVSARKDEKGNLTRYFLAIFDITEIKKFREGLEEKVKERTAELEEAKNRSEVLLASIGDGVFAIDREQNIIHFNRRAEELSGYKSAKVLGKPYYDFLQFIKEKDRIENLAFIRKAFEGEAADVADETILIRKDGSELPVANSAAPIKDEKGEVLGVIVTFRDASQERKIQQMRSEFMSLASHELKTPLGIIKGYLEMLTDETTGKLTKEQQKLISIATKASNNLLKLTYDLLETARLEEGRVKTESIMVDPIDLAEKAITTELRQAFKQKKQKFTFKKPESLPQIKVDPKFIMTPIQNLLSNASKYTPEKGKIEFKVSQKENRIIFKVTDSGIGIPKQQQFRVFQRFFRASNTTHLEKGTGLGLYMTKLMIEASGGRIWFESEEKKGSTFYFSLPAFG